MPSYTKLNFSDVKDLAPDFGMSDMGEARFARGALGADRIGLSRYRVNPGQRLGLLRPVRTPRSASSCGSVGKSALNAS